MNRPIPSSSFEESESFARSVYETGSGRPVRRITAFDQIGKSPESSASRLLVTNSGKYGLTKGGYQAEMLEPTPEATQIFDERIGSKDRARARVKLAIEIIPIFAALYEKLRDLKLPPRAALLDVARDVGVPNDYLEEAVDTFLVNLRSVGLLKNLSGAERIISIDHMLDSVPTSGSSILTASGASAVSVADEVGEADFDKTCFYISPIGDEGSDFRRHSDLFLNHIVEPALSAFELNVVRADRIGKPGIISRQIFDFIMRSRLVIVDLSHHNPNVFYELAVRHMIKKPVVQITRLADKVPFDINQMRTIVIDNTDIYSLLPKLEIYKSEISTQVRRALENEGAADNPITAYYPSLEIKQS